ncbi:hypothetical protein CJD36_001715 [Flavipsychrobacter stenotrophus]|uniref:Uncharacterized protein n=1 Tax=Flavipsychrobacter stenotrophus TaxID=2077091 RepID=A0A2S7SZY3_9BACT|nr:hypothetical protein [Flavipsychrobacter stenotrophus]PQJ12492.1 hypothetical protein CJD36_001715 [Flavipsychrobacter stenotrophus]
MKISFVILILLIITLNVTAQQSFIAVKSWADTGKIFTKPVVAVFNKPFVYQQKVVKEIPKDIYTCNFGFFCKQELKMHKAHVPVSVRLGSFEYCDYLELKGSSVK